MTPVTHAELSRAVVPWIPLVRYWAGRFARRLPPHVLRDDLVGAGMVGLVRALTRGTTSPGRDFQCYVRLSVRGAMLDELRAEDWLSRRTRDRVDKAGSEAGGKAGVGPQIVLDGLLLDVEDTREPEASGVGALNTLANAMRALSPYEREVIEWHYFRGRPLKALAARRGCSQPAVSQVHVRALQRLRTAVALDE
jgi:RNA polymerase sigma factor for flagellar operon FliA